MPVHLPLLKPEDLLPIPGVRLGTAHAGIRKAGRRDVLIIEVAAKSAVAGVFTTNRFCAAPVTVCQSHLAAGADIRYLLVNTGCANAGTGAGGLQDALLSCETLAKLTQVGVTQILPFSTGVIMERLPMDKLLAGLPMALADLSENHFAMAAEAIMTTDTQAKAYSGSGLIGGARVSVTGIAKGAGMIHPNMATMLSYVATDAKVSPEVLKVLTKAVADESFNCVTVDGDTSTNDSFVVIATGHASNPEITTTDSAAFVALKALLLSVALPLAHAMVRDGEGATKFMTIEVNGGKTLEECRKIGKAIAHSPLVKTAFFASDPNLGRILAAIGYAGVTDLEVTQVKLYLGDVLVSEKGGRAESYREEDGQRIMKEAEITIRVELGRGAVSSKVWTCDFSYDYVKINADYRS